MKLLFITVTNILKYTNTFQCDSIADIYLPIEVIFDYYNLWPRLIIPFSETGGMTKLCGITV